MVAHNMVRTSEIKNVFSEKKSGFDDSFDVTKCIKQPEMPDLLHMCEPCSELPSNISIMLFVLSFNKTIMVAKLPNNSV